MKRIVAFLFFTVFLFGVNCFGQNLIVQSWGVTQGSYDPAKGWGGNVQDESALRNVQAKLGKLWKDWKLTWDDIDGSIYVNDSFMEGTLYEDGKPIKKSFFRYDAYNDEMEIKETLASKEVSTLVKHPTYSCAFNGEEFYYLGYTNSEGESEKGYLTPLTPGGKYTLFIKRKKVFKEGKQATTSFEKSFAHRFLDKTDYFLNRAGEAPVYLKTKKSDVISIFPEENQADIKNYIKDKRLNVGNHDDLINLFTYANSL